ncbi:MAG: glycosyltransferase family 9 protein [Fimbriimonadaceae bacterium]
MKFLLVRFSAIGDCVMAAQAATSVRRACPDAFIAWAVESRCAAVVSSRSSPPNPLSPGAGEGELVDLRYEFPRDRWRSSRWSPVTWWDSLRTYSGLRKHRFDFGLDLQGHSKTALCLYLAKPKRRLAAQATDSLAKRLNPVAAGDPGSMHVVEWNHLVLSQLGDFPAIDRPMMPSLESERARVIPLLGPTPDRIATISTGAGALDKQWLIERWMSVGEALEERGFAVSYLGGPTDPHPSQGGDLVGRLPLNETMAAVKASAIHLCSDTGTGHIAAAYGVPVVSVFGPTDPARYRPWTDRGRVLRNGRETSGTSVEDVLAAVDSLLA